MADNWRVAGYPYRQMRTICVQFQPRRADGVEPHKVCGFMLQIALEADVQTFSVERSRARDSYVNFLFSSPATARIWRSIQEIALRHRTFGARIRRSTIVTCQGTRGWDNYRLLHHFDSDHKLDRLKWHSYGTRSDASQPAKRAGRAVPVQAAMPENATPPCRESPDENEPARTMLRKARCA